MTDIPSASREVRAAWGRNYGGYAGNRFMLLLGAWCLPVGYAAVALATIGFYVLLPKVRRASRQYLALALGRRNFLTARFRVYRHLFTFGQMLLDRAVALASDGRGFHFACTGQEHLAKALAADSGVLMLTAHVGCSEISAPVLSKMTTRPVAMVMYHDPTDKTEKFHAAHRKALQHVQIISTTDPMKAGLEIMQALRRNAVVGIRADRALTGRAIEGRLFDTPVRVPAGPFLTAVLTGVPVVTMYTVRTGYRQYTGYITPPRHYRDQPDQRDEMLRQAAQDYLDSLQLLLQRYPMQWFNFYDYFGEGGNARR